MICASADDLLTTNLNNEIAARISGDDTLQSNLTDAVSDLLVTNAQEVAARQAGDFQNSVEIGK